MVLTQTMKIIKPYFFMRAPRLSAFPGHGGAVRVLQIYLKTPIRRGGAPSGAAEFIKNNYEDLQSITHSRLM
jgi:hypothetical protein